MKKVFFWLIAGLLSVYMAEVFSGSYPFPFLDVWGWLVLLPLYGLHTIVLATIVLRRKGDLFALYLAGMLFGLYEAYITKVLWISLFGATAPQLAGVGIFDVILLVGFWHPLLSFIFPLGIAERLLTQGQRIVRIPRWLSVTTAIGVLIIMPKNELLIPSVVLGAASIGIFVAIWRFRGLHRGTTLKSLLPGKWLFRISVAGLALVYLVLGSILNADKIPPLSDHVVIWLMYTGIIWLLVRRLRSCQFS